jgi:hypothetical protein
MMNENRGMVVEIILLATHKLLTGVATGDGIGFEICLTKCQS